MAAANEQTSALSRLLVVVENYPTLKSDATFARLMDELAGTENRIAVERMRYNEKVQEYNTSRRPVPGEHHGRHFRLQGRLQALRGAGSRPRWRRKSTFHAQNPRLFRSGGSSRDPQFRSNPSTPFPHPN